MAKPSMTDQVDCTRCGNPVTRREAREGNCRQCGEPVPLELFPPEPGRSVHEGHPVHRGGER